MLAVINTLFHFIFPDVIYVRPENFAYFLKFYLLLSSIIKRDYTAREERQRAQTQPLRVVRLLLIYKVFRGTVRNLELE